MRTIGEKSCIGRWLIVIICGGGGRGERRTGEERTFPAFNDSFEDFVYVDRRTLGEDTGDGTTEGLIADRRGNLRCAKRGYVRKTRKTEITTCRTYTRL